jgi:two-component system, chemotaxis family, CheB/CheR fusion protein
MEAPIAEVFKAGKDVVNIAVTVRMNGEGARDFLIDYYPYEEDGRTAAVGVVLKDVTELRRLERELRRLMDELQHRVKNTLATVASIVNQTVASKTNRAELVDTLKRRIGALAATHNLLTLADWREAALRDILEAELTPYHQDGRISLSGPNIALPPKHALCVTLTLHELTTNAAKYGALAQPDADLRIEWVVSEDGDGKTLTIRWVESGVTGVPNGKIKESFGSKLIKQAVAHDLQGTCDYRLEPDGLKCTITFPF